MKYKSFYFFSSVTFFKFIFKLWQANQFCHMNIGCIWKQSCTPAVQLIWQKFSVTHAACDIHNTLKIPGVIFQKNIKYSVDRSPYILSPTTNIIMSPLGIVICKVPKVRRMPGKTCIHFMREIYLFKVVTGVTYRTGKHSSLWKS